MAMAMRAFRGTRVLRHAAAAGATTAGPPAAPPPGGPPAIPPAGEAAKKEFDWGGIDDIVFTEEGKRELDKLRFAIKDATRIIETKFVAERPKPNWEQYKKDLGPGIVTLFEKAYASLEFPKFEDTVTPQIKEKFDEYGVMADEYEKEMEEMSAKAKVEIEKIRYIRENLKTLTINQVLDIYPEWRKEIDEELRNLQW